MRLRGSAVARSRSQPPPPEIPPTGGSGIYYGINKNRPDLKEELDNAMRKMESDKPFYADELYQQYLATQSVSVLTGEETQWLSDHGAIRIGFWKGDDGVSTQHSDAQGPVGIVNDYTAFASTCLNNGQLEFALVGFDTQQALLQALQEDRTDLIFHASQNPYASEQNGLSLSNTVWTFNIAAITAQGYFDETAENTVAVSQDNDTAKWYLSYNYPQWEIREYASQEEAKKAVRDGKADCFIVRASQVTQCIQGNKLHGVFLMQPDNVSFAVRRGNSLLLSILNNVLVLSRIEFGKITLEEKPKKVEEVFDACMVMMSPDIEKKHHTVTAAEKEEIRGKRLLLAEDNDLNAEIATALLEEEGLQVDRVADGVQCVEKIERCGDGFYSLILMDIQMPDLDGCEATDKIRKLQDRKKASIPIIAMTANAFSEDKARALAAGMNDHVAKPIDMNELMHTLLKYL